MTSTPQPGQAGPAGPVDLAALTATLHHLTTAVTGHDRRLRRIERTTARRKTPPRRRTVQSSRQPRPATRPASRAAAAEPEPETAAADLAAWVGWLQHTYRPAGSLPSSWPADPGTVAELAALHTAWQEAFAPAGRGSERVRWHDALDSVLDRLARRAAAAPPTATTPALEEWVTWLRERYSLTDRIPADWHSEPAIAAELAALHRAWCTAHTPTASGFDPLRWHDALPAALHRVEDWRNDARRRRATTPPAGSP